MSNENTQNLPLVPEWVAKRIDHWIKRKNTNDLSKYKITRKNIYILPSKSGWLFILTLIAILSGAINYNNSMAYLLCFFLASLGFIAMLQTHENLNNITITPARSASVHCGQHVEFIFNIENTSHHNHFSIYINNNTKDISIKKKSKSEFSLIEKTIKRGKINPARFKVYTEFPLGLFHAWTQVNITNPIIIYPKPVKSSLIDTISNEGKNQNQELTGDDDYAGVREFRSGDNLKKLAWKAIARTNQLLTKEFHTNSGDYLILDFEKLKQISNTEEKLSILCGLILEANTKQINYGLKISGKTIKPSIGENHLHQCLSLLALYKQ